MPDQAPVVVTCSVWVPSTGAGGIFPDGQLVAVHSSVIVVPGLLFHMYQPVAAEAPPYHVPVKDAGTDNPSSKLGLFRIPAGTVKLSPLLDFPFTMTTTFPVVAPAGATTGNVVVIVNGKSSNGLSFTVPAGILNNPSFELGLSVPASFTGTWYGGASAATGWYVWNNNLGTTMTELCTATSCPSGKIPPAPVDGTHTLHVTATGAWSGIYQVFPATTLASAGLWLDVISGTVIVE